MERRHLLMLTAAAAASFLAGGCDRPNANRPQSVSAAPDAGMGKPSDNSANSAANSGATADNAANSATENAADSAASNSANTVADNTADSTANSASSPTNNGTNSSTTSMPASDDATINAKVTESIKADPSLQSMQIKVDTKNGTVMLTGMVDTPDLRARAHQIAETTPGVAGVVDNLAIKNAG
jgi:osmotically-inducible protein OsmY